VFYQSQLECQYHKHWKKGFYVSNNTLVIQIQHCELVLFKDLGLKSFVLEDNLRMPGFKIHEPADQTLLMYSMEEKLNSKKQSSTASRASTVAVASVTSYLFLS
jgi:hypothetical protein